MGAEVEPCVHESGTPGRQELEEVRRTLPAACGGGLALPTAGFRPGNTSLGLRASRSVRK